MTDDRILFEAVDISGMSDDALVATDWQPMRANSN